LCTDEFSQRAFYSTNGSDGKRGGLMVDYDVLIIGAGAAGLVAAADLHAAGVSVGIVEARDRMGGRIDTRFAAGLDVPIELGAEFIHGRAPLTARWLTRAGSVMIDAPETRFTLDRGVLSAGNDLFAQMTRSLQRVARPRKDLSFADFLNGPARRALTPRQRAFARTLVEGFDAADATRVSTLEILDEWAGSSAADAPTFRPHGGYAALLSGLTSALDVTTTDVRLNTIVREVHWQHGAVKVLAECNGRSVTLQSRRAIVTLPLGVLQASGSAGAVQFAPDIRKEAALSGLGAGPVIKIVFRFRTAFWEQLANRKFEDAAFFHAPGQSFPTFWTTLPHRSPLLIAWCAGPAAARLSGHSQADVLEHAMQSLDALFGKTVLREQVLATYMHDWQADPFARGAYSYVTVGGSEARRLLAAPRRETLFFAGEAADTEGESGTVAGALRSGARVAREVAAIMHGGSRRR
jgi:monoamine oxidase